jgi:branched-chain amino acid transport system permease protein
MKRQSLAWPLAIFGVFAGIAVLRWLGVSLGGFVPLVAGRIMIFALAAMSLDFILGVGGLASFGHAAPLAIGAYVVAVLDHAGIHEALVVVPAAMAASGLFALATGAIALRTRGINFIMITLAFAQMIYFGAGSLNDLGGDDGYSLDARTTVAGYHLLDRTGLYAATLVVLFVSWLVLRMIVASRFGRALSAVRQNRVRVQSLGINAYAVELVALVIAAMIAGLAGVLLANEAEFVSPAYAAWGRSGGLMVMVLLGGAGSLHGAILGAAMVVLFEEGVGRLTSHWPLILGPLLVLAVLFLRRGIAGIGDKNG